MKHIEINAKVVAVCMLASLLSCGGKQTTEQTGEVMSRTSSEPVIIETNKLTPGIKEVEIRSVDPANPPVILDFTAKLNTQPFSLKDHFTKATCVTLRHPLPLEQGGFLYDASIVISYDQGMSSSRGVNTNVQICDGHILTTDLFGALVYDKNGQLIDSTHLSHIDKLKYKVASQEIEYEAKNRKVTTQGLSLAGNNMYQYIERDTVNNYFKMDWNSLKDNKLVQEIRFIDQRHTAYLTRLNDSTLINISGNFMSPDLLKTFDKNTYDTLCVFKNYNLPTIKITGSYAFPEELVTYFNKDKFYFRQPFNDTIFSIAASNRIKPEYVFQFGENRLDINTGLQGDKSQKNVIKGWMDANDFILITFSKNYDCPNTRNENSVIYSYGLYDKAKKQLTLLPGGHIYPEEFFLPAELPDGIPVILGELSWQDDKLVSSYTKRKLQAMQKMKNFSQLPTTQQDRVRKLAESLADNEMIVMTLE